MIVEKTADAFRVERKYTVYGNSRKDFCSEYHYNTKGSKTEKATGKISYGMGRSDWKSLKWKIKLEETSIRQRWLERRVFDEMVLTAVCPKKMKKKKDEYDEEEEEDERMINATLQQVWDKG